MAELVNSENSCSGELGDTYGMRWVGVMSNEVSNWEEGTVTSASYCSTDVDATSYEDNGCKVPRDSNRVLPFTTYVGRGRGFRNKRHWKVTTRKRGKLPYKARCHVDIKPKRAQIVQKRTPSCDSQASLLPYEWNPQKDEALGYSLYDFLTPATLPPRPVGSRPGDVLSEFDLLTPTLLRTSAYRTGFPLLNKAKPLFKSQVVTKFLNMPSHAFVKNLMTMDACNVR